MRKFDLLDAPAAPLPIAHVDTDQIIPVRYITTLSRQGLAPGLFAGWRYDASGRERADFVLNQPAWRNAGMLIAYDNFGCGSSREHAAWALGEFGVRCVIAPSFGDIFRINCVKNGLLPIRLDRSECERLIEAAQAEPGRRLTVDLARRTLASADGRTRLTFDIGATEQDRLLQGLDEIDLSLRHEGAIAAYENGRA